MMGNGSLDGRVRWGLSIQAPLVALCVAGCSAMGLGGGLELNITDQQTRPVRVEVEAPSADARLLEPRDGEELEIGQGSATIDRYVLQRVTFGADLATGYFLCEAPCADPLSSFLVASSPEQLFAPSGELQLVFRTEAPDGASQDLARTVRPAMLEALWRSGLIEVRAAR